MTSSCIIHMKDTLTGVICTVAEDRDWLDEDSACEFHWTEGGNACDCNRGHWFAAMTGDRSHDDTGCGDTRYVITQVTDLDGNVIDKGEVET